MKCGGKDKHRQSDGPAPVDLSSLQVRPILPDEQATWNELMATHHYLGFRQLVGESLKYIATLHDEWVALIGWGAAAFKCHPRDAWIGWTPEIQWQRLRYVVNNQRFLVLPTKCIKNLASKTLALNLKRLSSDWEAIYGHPVVLAETFIDPTRFTGTCYRAANWQPLGETRGFGRNGAKYYHHGQPKVIWVYPLRPDARELLSAPFLPPQLAGKELILVNLNTANINGKGGLMERLATLKDPRKRRGIRHSQISILAVAICALLSGARSFAAIGQWASYLSQNLLKRLGCSFNYRLGRYVPPSEPTIRRTLQSIDADEVDHLIGLWLAEQGGPDSDAVAVDGKTLRGSGGANGKRVHLVAALLPREGVVVSQKQVGEKSNEITAFKPLLEPLDLEGKTVTADAMHATAEHARYVVEDKKADYVFTVKGNQPSLLEAISNLDDEDFSPSGHNR